MPSFDLRSPQVAQTPPPALKVTAAYGRLYVTGPAHRLAASVRGAALDKDKQVVELSLTLETLRELRKVTRTTPEQFARFLEPAVLAWARAAHQIEKQIALLHNRIAEGWRKPMPWYDPSGTKPPFDHQKVMATVATEIDGCAFLCEVGTGKTRATIEAIVWQLTHGTCDIIFVVAPKGVLRTWRKEIPQWSQGLQLRVLEGPMVRRQQFITTLTIATDFVPLQEKLVILTNYEGLYPMRHAIIELCKARKVGFVLDEMHRTRNPDTKVSKSAMKIAQFAKWRLGLTGSPVLNGGALDVWAQWYIIDLGVTFGANFVQYKRDFFTEDPYAHSIDPIDGALDEVGVRLRRRGLRYRKVDCFDLPPQLWETVDVEMSPEQSKAYNEMATYLVARLEGQRELPPTPYLTSLGIDWEDSELPEPQDEGRVATAANQLAMILRLTQITSGFVNDEHGALYRFNPNPKMDAAIEFIEESLVQTPVIVWCRYKADIDEFMRRLASHNPVQIDGRTSQKRSQRLPGMSLSDEAEDDFQSGRSRLLIGNPAAGGEGRNLQAAGVAVYYSQGYSLLHRVQSEGRNHRAGSEIHQRITYATFVCQATVDETIMAALEGHKSVAEVVTDLRRQLGVRENVAA